MGRAIITYNEIIEINQLLREQGLSFKLHLHDACGSQSFTIEPLSNCACEGKFELMKASITHYFAERGIVVKFMENELEFMLL